MVRLGSAWGCLFEYVLSIVREHQPKEFILENVCSIKRHNRGATWRTATYPVMQGRQL